MPTEKGPIPNYPSNRLIGPELEFDAGNTEFRLPNPVPRGWSSKGDGSLRNGRELVLEPPLPLNRSYDVVKALCDGCEKARTNIGKRGGFHVHVQGHDYNHDDAYRLVQLYTYYQPVINSLVAKSRVNNQYCPPYKANVTRNDVIQMFHLDTVATSRQDARCSRAYSVVNLAMLRTRVAQQRSVEFRQGSPSKRFENVWGWICLMVALTDIAKTDWTPPRGQATLESFVELIRTHEQSVGGTHLADWVLWRFNYLNAEPTDEMVQQVVGLIGQSARGLFHVGRALNINYALAGKLLEKATQKGLITPVNRDGIVKWKAKYEAWVARDLETLEAAFTTRMTVPVAPPLPTATVPAPEVPTPAVAPAIVAPPLPTATAAPAIATPRTEIAGEARRRGVRRPRRFAQG